MNYYKAIPFLIIYACIFLLDVLLGFLHYQEYRILTKPLIVISLIIYFTQNAKHLPKKIYQFTLLAMCFSLIGDVLLHFNDRSPSFFTLGLFCFLLAHISYSIVFLHQRAHKLAKESWIIIMGLLSCGLAVFSMLMNSLGNLMFPVILYIIAILVMAITSLNRMGMVSNKSYILVFLGAFIFIISDSILAINKFSFDIPWGGFWVMATYATAQFLIIYGLLASKE